MILPARRAGLAVGGVAIAVALGAAPAAYAVDTAATPHSGAIPSAGPAAALGPGGPGGNAPAPGGPSLGAGGGPGRIGGPGAGGPGAGGFGRPGRGSGQGAGGLLEASRPGRAITRALGADAGRYRWVAAIVGSDAASGYQLATGDPVMAIGGFNGTDPAPMLAQFEAFVRAGAIHYFIASGGANALGTGGSATSASRITAWVERHVTATTIDGVTVYDLTQSSA